MIRDKMLRFFAVVSAGLAMQMAFAPMRLWALAWFAFIPFFWAVIDSEKSKEAGMLGYIFGLVFYGFGLCWMPNVLSAWSLLLWAVFALWPMLYALLMKKFYARLKHNGLFTGILCSLASGFVWAAIEYIRAELLPFPCPWLCLGYSQSNAPLIYQSLALWGVYGLGAFMVFFSSGIAFYFKKARFTPLIAVLALTLLCAGGYYRGRYFKADSGRPVNVALVQTEFTDMDDNIALSSSPEVMKSDILLWPETSFIVPKAGGQKHINYITDSLKDYGGVLALASGRYSAVKRYKTDENFIVFHEKGKEDRIYNKMHPVPFVESGLVRNKRPEPVETSVGKIGAQICYDLAFEDGVRALNKKGAEIIISPALDPYYWGSEQHEQHSDMSSARAVESGLWVVRAASSGRSQIIDPLGKTVKELPVGEKGVLTGRAFMRRGGTVYTSFGWIIIPLSLVVLAAVLVVCLVKKTSSYNDVTIAVKEE